MLAPETPSSFPPSAHAASSAVDCDPGGAAPGLTVEQLEEGLRMLDRGEIDANLFWDQNVVAFRQTVIVAIEETSKGVTSMHVSEVLRAELQSQIEPLKFYLSLANRYLARRSNLH